MTDKMINILYVCIGNTCRSAMAQCLTSNLFQDLAKSDSAGIDVHSINANSLAIKVMDDIYYLSLTSHIPKKIENVNLSEYDLIIAMDNEVQNYINQNYPLYKSINWEIDDPYGKDYESYKSTANLILGKIEEILHNLPLQFQ